MKILRAILALPPGASTVSRDIDLLHFFVISVTMLMSTYVFATAAWFCIRWYRRSEGQLTERLAASGRAEAITIAAVLGMFILWWVIGYRQYARLTTPPQGADVVYVDAKQWMWKFSYPAGGGDANDVLTVPAGRPIKLVMTSRDVIHSFFVPAFRVKADVIPGRYVTTWFEAAVPGVYPIWCAEYCGVSHSLMRGEIVVLPPADYADWLRTRRTTATRADCGRGPGSCGGGDLASFGREVAVRRDCVACHTLDGQRHIGPTWRGLFGSERVLVGGRRVIADEAYLTRSMMEPNADVVAGYTPVMPTYQGTLTAAEAGAIVELIRTLRDLPPAPGIELPRLQVEPAADGGTTDGGTPR